MIDLVSLCAGSAATTVGVLAGTFLRRRTPASGRALCSCGHGAGSHDPDTSNCRAEIRRPNRWDEYGEPNFYEWVPCPCLTNDGPEPLAVLEARLTRHLPAHGQERPTRLGGGVS